MYLACVVDHTVTVGSNVNHHTMQIRQSANNDFAVGMLTAASKQGTSPSAEIPHMNYASNMYVFRIGFTFSL